MRLVDVESDPARIEDKWISDTVPPKGVLLPTSTQWVRAGLAAVEVHGI